MSNSIDLFNIAAIRFRIICVFTKNIGCTAVDQNIILVFIRLYLLTKLRYFCNCSGNYPRPLYGKHFTVRIQFDAAISSLNNVFSHLRRDFRVFFQLIIREVYHNRIVFIGCQLSILDCLLQRIVNTFLSKELV